jgi:hypothetical protein
MLGICGEDDEHPANNRAGKVSYIPESAHSNATHIGE